MAVEFKNNNLTANALVLVDHLGLEKEQEVPMASFEIEVSGASTGLVIVDKGKYKSALYLLYLAELRFNEQIHRHQTWHSCSFCANPMSKILTPVYFDDELCDDAKNNPKTKHTTIRDLLAGGQVIIQINPK